MYAGFTHTFFEISFVQHDEVAEEGAAPRPRGRPSLSRGASPFGRGVSGSSGRLPPSTMTDKNGVVAIRQADLSSDIRKS